MENLKIFIYDNKGKLISEKDLSVMETAVKEVEDHNLNNLDNLYNLYINTIFPPNNCSWDNLEKTWKNVTGEKLKIFIHDENGLKTQEYLYSDFSVFLNYFKENKINFFDVADKFLVDFSFPPENHVFDKNAKKWIDKNEKKWILDEFNVDKDLNDFNLLEKDVDYAFEAEGTSVLKVFVYNSKGEKIREEYYNLFVETYDFVLEHNTKFPDDPYNIYSGKSFPPKGYRWSEEIGDWLELTKFEKWKQKELDIPNDCFVVDNIIVRKSLSILNKEGLYKILPTQKIDEEYNIIVDKSQQELIDEGLMDWEEVYQNYYKIFKKKLDDYLDVIYFKYPKSVIFQFSYKSDIAQQWKKLTEEKREEAKILNFNEFILLISEFKNINRNYTLDEIASELDVISDKILQKKYEIDSKFGFINNFFNSLNEEILLLKEEKNFLKLFDFVSNIENKINQWIKS